MIMKVYEATECTRCKGEGRCLYSNTSTWRQASIAGRAMTSDICDVCWGSGDSTKPWTNLLALAEQNKSWRMEATALQKQVTELTESLYHSDEVIREQRSRIAELQADNAMANAVVDLINSSPRPDMQRRLQRAEAEATGLEAEIHRLRAELEAADVIEWQPIITLPDEDSDFLFFEDRDVWIDNAQDFVAEEHTATHWAAMPKGPR